jgi:hypothetical protein
MARPSQPDAVGTHASSAIASRNERVAVRFWVLLIGFFVSYAGALAAVWLQIDVLRLESAFVGAFIGSLPVIFFPVVARVAHRPDTPLARREGIRFRLATCAFGAVVVIGTYVLPWSDDHRASTLIGSTGLGVAILASWFLPHFPTALRLWTRKMAQLD